MAPKVKARVERKPEAKPNALKKWLVRFGVIASIYFVFSYLDSIKVCLPHSNNVKQSLTTVNSNGGMFSNRQNSTPLRVRQLTNMATTPAPSSHTLSPTSLQSTLPLKSASYSTLANMNGSSTTPAVRWARCTSSMQASPSI